MPPLLGRLLLCVLLLALAAGCASLAPPQFAGGTPALDPMAYYTGPSHSWGVFENRAGQPSKRFTTVCRGRLVNGALALDQDFTYDDGRHQMRHWLIRRLDAHRFEATANDVVGTSEGEVWGNAFRWDYTVELTPGNALSRVRLRQWMYLQADGRTLLNRAVIRKAGVAVAQVTEVFRRD